MEIWRWFKGRGFTKTKYATPNPQDYDGKFVRCESLAAKLKSVKRKMYK